MFLTLATANTKLGNVATTYAPIANTCPAACPLKANGCYAQSGHVAIHNARLERKCADQDAIQVASLEAEEIAKEARFTLRPLRLHTSGDAATAAAAAILSAACEDWRAPVWTYTHGWRNTPRRAWGRVSVLASCESPDAAKQALAAGYAPALVVAEHPPDGRATVHPSGLRLIPCPEQTRGITCDRCRLCWDDAKLRSQNAAITFAAHGASKKRALTVIQA